MMIFSQNYWYFFLLRNRLAVIRIRYVKLLWLSSRSVSPLTFDSLTSCFCRAPACLTPVFSPSTFASFPLGRCQATSIGICSSTVLKNCENRILLLLSFGVSICTMQKCDSHSLPLRCQSPPHRFRWSTKNNMVISSSSNLHSEYHH